MSCRLSCDCYSCNTGCQAVKIVTVQAASSMAVLESMLRQDGLKLAEARVSSAVYAQALFVSTGCILLLHLEGTLSNCQLHRMGHTLQVRALTREVGSLKEDLRRETKRRERAVVATREAEEEKVELQKRVKQLEYSKG